MILNVNGLRVAVIGAMTDDLKTLTIPTALGQWHTTGVLETARKYAAELKGKSDLIILLGHITPREELKFLSDATEIPVLVTGHAHNGILQPLMQDGRMLVRVKGYAEELGRLELKVDTEKKAPVGYTWKHIQIDSNSTPPDAEVAAAVKHWEDEVSARVDQPLAVSSRAFDKREVKGLIEQAMRTQTGADFAFMNLGGVRDSVPKGQIAGSQYLEHHAVRQPRGRRKVQGARSSRRCAGRQAGGTEPVLHAGGHGFHCRESGHGGKPAHHRPSVPARRRLAARRPAGLVPQEEDDRLDVRE